MGVGGGGDRDYKPYRYVPPKRVWFLGLFGLKTGIHSAIIVSGIIGYGFRENYGMNVFMLSIPNDRDMPIRKAFEEISCLRSNLSN